MRRLFTTSNIFSFLAVATSVSSFQVASLSLDRRLYLTTSLFLANDEEDKHQVGRRARKKLEKKQDYERRRNMWLEKYGTFEALQSTFGTGPILGDLSPEQTRSLYHTLLPRSLLGLYEMGLMKPDELAPLAYNARIAAKKYARSRCKWTGRVATSAFDQYRNLRDKGRFGSSSMTWEEIWQKYEAQIVQEECAEALNGERRQKNEDSLTMRIYLRILERSCSTNQAFDSLFLQENENDSDNLAHIAFKLENDVRDFLLSPKESTKAMEMKEKAAKKQQKKERKVVKERQKTEKQRRKDDVKERKSSIRKKADIIIERCSSKNHSK